MISKLLCHSLCARVLNGFLFLHTKKCNKGKGETEKKYDEKLIGIQKWAADHEESNENENEVE